MINRWIRKDEKEVETSALTVEVAKWQFSQFLRITPWLISGFLFGRQRLALDHKVRNPPAAPCLNSFFHGPRWWAVFFPLHSTIKSRSFRCPWTRDDTKVTPIARNCAACAGVVQGCRDRDRHLDRDGRGFVFFDCGSWTLEEPTEVVTALQRRSQRQAGWMDRVGEKCFACEKEGWMVSW